MSIPKNFYFSNLPVLKKYIFSIKRLTSYFFRCINTSMDVKRKITISLTDDNIKDLDYLSCGYSRSVTISLLIRKCMLDGNFVLGKNIFGHIGREVPVGNDI